ncbi:MAG: hypothetical protein JKX78_03700 [Alteromonadaceae bacterium]|nr:hypothetical protein [Alteromonadaceae bacterium]MBL4909123.1 hypothetical protein [Alteromonadaceae bacterium]
MSLSAELNHFRIPMLGRFLGHAMQNTHGSFLEGEVYVITAYNPQDKTVQTTGRTTRNRWIDANSFEVVRNASWDFAEGHCAPHLEAASDFTNDLAKFEDHGHDDHIETLAFAPFLNIDLANSPDYSATGRYIGDAWPEMTSRMLRPARPLAADENQHKILSHDFTSLEQKAMTYARKGKSRANAMFHYATGRAEFLAQQHRERRFASLGPHADRLFLTLRDPEESRAMLKEKFEAIQYSAKQEPSLTDDISDAFLAVQRLMQVPDHLLVEKQTLTADAMHQMQFNCRCVMPDLTKGAFILDEGYIERIEDGKPTYSKPFMIKGAEMSAKFEKTMRARLERDMTRVNRTVLGMSPVSSGVYNCTVECIMGIGDFIQGRTYRAIFNGISQNIRVEHPDTLVPVPVDRLYFDRKQELTLMDDRDGPMSPTFEEQTTKDESYGPKDSSPEETTFVHKSATRKTQEVHEENEGTANLRKYRFNPEA